jgi:hypothetical protein
MLSGNCQLVSRRCERALRTPIGRKGEWMATFILIRSYERLGGVYGIPTVMDDLIDTADSLGRNTW